MGLYPERTFEKRPDKLMRLHPTFVTYFSEPAARRIIYSPSSAASSGPPTDPPKPIRMSGGRFAERGAAARSTSSEITCWRWRRTGPPAPGVRSLEPASLYEHEPPYTDLISTGARADAAEHSLFASFKLGVELGQPSAVAHPPTYLNKVRPCRPAGSETVRCAWSKRQHFWEA